MSPVRIQRRRTSGWRMPSNATYVGRPSRWGNPYAVGETLVRYPAIDGGEWELEGRSGKTPGEHHVYRHPDGSITWHRVEYATRAQVVELYALHVGPMGSHELDVAEVRRVLGGRDLACWCPLTDEDGNPVPCHADVLLRLANGGDDA
ncbi:DUF4326 domain-containing protein [Actinomadura litoris]|uniref:DUF4326 domain-containing protein n=1 Tax=Actinomadura litoris TaxID=2678616 RepID=UPI001FA7D920|nr:DUF4326 domain-containing protein [Actinomadura litoris]